MRFFGTLELKRVFFVKKRIFVSTKEKFLIGDI